MIVWFLLKSMGKSKHVKRLKVCLIYFERKIFWYQIVLNFLSQNILKSVLKQTPTFNS